MQEVLVLLPMAACKKAPIPPEPVHIGLASDEFLHRLIEFE